MLKTLIEKLPERNLQGIHAFDVLEACKLAFDGFWLENPNHSPCSCHGNPRLVSKHRWVEFHKVGKCSHGELEICLSEV
jgi:hypothetical protein